MDGAFSAIYDLRERIDQMQTADEIAAAVSDALKRERRFGLNLLQKAGALLMAAVLMGGAVAAIIQALSGHH